MKLEKKYLKAKNGIAHTEITEIHRKINGGMKKKDFLCRVISV